MIESTGWNPWHGCTKIRAGCKYCYVYRQDEMYGADVSFCCKSVAYVEMCISYIPIHFADLIDELM